MKIAKIETIRVGQLPDIIWVQVHTDSGLIGLGETWYAVTTVEAAVHDHFGPMLIGRDALAIERHWTDMFKLSDHAGYGGAEMRAISAIDMALWDIKGQHTGVPVYELLGGAVRKKIRVYATGGPYDGWKERARELVDDGLIAIKIGPTIPVATAPDGQLPHPKDLDRALQPFRDVPDSVGDQLMMANDGHGKWALPQAIQIAQAMEPLDMMWQEDLMPLLNADSLAELQRSTSTPVCISERLLGRWQFRQFIENGSARIVMPDLIWTGGISETHKIAVMASAHQVPVAPHDATGPVNIFACAQICMSAPNAMIMEHVRDYFYGWYGDFVDPNVPIEHGWLHAPQNPGIGTRLRPEVRDRRDATVRVSDEDVRLGLPDEEWNGHDARSPEMEAEVAEIREWRRPGSG